MRMEVARMMTFGCANRRDIVKRLMLTCPTFKQLTYPDAVKMFRYYESNGLVQYSDTYIVIYAA